MESSKTTNTVIVGEDTDLLVLLCYHMDVTYEKLIFQSEMRASSRKVRTWDLKKANPVMGQNLCKILPFVHAILGCDTTSRFFGVGKGQILKKAVNGTYFQDIANKFLNANSKEEASRIGEEALVCLYNGVPHEGLNLLRFRKFTAKVMTSSKFVEVYCLPPTSNAAKFHILRVFLQLKQWIGEADGMEAKDWGWSVENNLCFPIRSSLPPAPDELLKTITANVRKTVKLIVVTVENTDWSVLWPARSVEEIRVVICLQQLLMTSWIPILKTMSS